MSPRVLTWNLQGREQPDLGEVADVVRSFEPTVVAIQEVQRRQAAAVAAALGWQHRWTFKHWPVVAAAEGLAVLAPQLDDVATRVLAGGWRLWSWRRRVAIAATVGGVRVVNVHLGAHVGDDERARQARVAIGLAGTGAAVVVGDLNVTPGSRVLGVFGEDGFVDAWTGAGGETNWEPGPRDGPPTQRLDYVLGRGISLVAAQVPTYGADGFDRYPALSDHLPVVVDLTAPGGSARSSS